MKALALQTVGLGKRFGAFAALDGVDLRVEPGEVHALLGENGAGKSTLVKCVAGFHRADAGSILIDGREQDIANPIVARQLGIGMVYQHFTLAPGMSVAENLLLAGGRTPSLIRWRRHRAALEAFLQATPFRLDLDAVPANLAAGEKQKLELLKQLYLQPRLLILDEPTSVLTPQEADEVLGHVRSLARSGVCSVLIITHKFREVMQHADRVTVLRRGRRVFQAAVAQADAAVLAQAMVGQGSDGALSPPVDVASVQAAGPAPGGLEDAAVTSPGARPQDVPALAVQGLQVMGDRGVLAVRDLSLQVMGGEILGVAGVSGNGQRELLQALVGQRPRQGGAVAVDGQPYRGTRAQNRTLRVRSLPEEPLRNACVAELSVAENMALRDFDQPPLVGWGHVRLGRWRERARAWIAQYGVKTRSERAPMRSLSGGNVQRAVLARELAGTIRVLIAANPVFGLDFSAVAEIHQRLRAVRSSGGAVLLISEDLDELLALSDRIVVMSEGRIVHEAVAASAQREVLGRCMAGGHVASHPMEAS